MISVEWENPRTCFTPIDQRFTIKLMERTQRTMEWNGTVSVLPHPTIRTVGLVEISWMRTVTGRLSVELRPNAQNHSCICQLSRCCARFNPPAEYNLPWTTSRSCLLCPARSVCPVVAGLAGWHSPVNPCLVNHTIYPFPLVVSLNSTNTFQIWHCNIVNV